jgi:hypothetical protein
MIKQKQDEINLANIQGAGISGRQIKILTDQVAIERQAADLGIKVAAGVATSSQLAAQKQNELNQLVAKGKLSYDDIAKGAQGYQKELEGIIAKQEIFVSALPGLKSLEIESKSLRTQLDTGLTTSLNNVTSNLADISMGTVKAKDGFRNLELQVIRSLDEMLIKMGIVAPIAKALQSSFGGLFGSSFTPGNIGGTSGGLAAIHHAGGIVGDPGMPSRYIHPAYFDNAPRFGSGGLVGGEVPIIAHVGERVSTPEQWAAQGRGGGATHITIGGPVVNVQGDASKNTIALIQDALVEHDKTIGGKVVMALHDAKRRSVRT